MINRAIQERRKKVDIELLADELGRYLTEPKEQQDLIAELIEKFDAHENTIKKCLKEVADSRLVIHDLSGYPCKLLIEMNNGKTTIYKLLKLPESL